ncbi:MAG: hypothetical protein ACOYOV_05140 [Bacteroidales bacterium]
MKFSKVLTVIMALMLSAMFGNFIAAQTGWNPLVTTGGLFLLGALPTGAGIGSLLSSAGINWSGITPDNGAIKAANELIMMETLKAGSIDQFHTLMTKVANGEMIAGIGAFAEVGLKEGTTCAPTYLTDQATVIEKTWAIGGWEIAEAICYKDVEATAGRMCLKTGTDIADVTGTDVVDMVVPRMEESMLRMYWRILWFGDTAAALQANGGKLKAGTEIKLFNITDGFFKRLIAIIAATPSRKVSIAANNNTSIATLVLNASGVASVAVTAGGTNYVVNDTVTINGGTAGYLALLKVTAVDGNGAVTAASVTSPGSGYTAGAGKATTVVSSAAGAGFTANVTLSTGGGTGYAVNDVVEVLGGTAGSLATLRIVSVNAGVVTSFVIVKPGAGYSVANMISTVDTNGAGSGMLVNITALNATTYATQLADLTDAVEILTSLSTKANIKLRGLADKQIMCTRSIADAYQAQLKKGNIYTEIQWKSIETGIINPDGNVSTMQYFEVNGVKCFPIDLWDEYIQAFEDNGTKWNNPHRAVMTTKANMLCGTPSSELIKTLQIWFSNDDQNVKMLARDKIGTMIFDDTLVQVAI